MEFAILLPVVIIIVLAGLEYSHALKAHQRLNSVVRETAISLYRECLGSPLDPASQIETCTIAALDQVRQQTSGTIGNVRLVAIWRRYDGVQNPRCTLFAGPTTSGPSGSNTRINPVIGSFESVCQQQERLLTIEGFYAYTPLLGTLARFYGAWGGELYAVLAV